MENFIWAENRIVLQLHEPFHREKEKSHRAALNGEDIGWLGAHAEARPVLSLIEGKLVLLT